MGQQRRVAAPGRPRAVIFDLYITLTDFEAERQRPAFTATLADTLGVDPDAFATLMRASFERRASGSMGDARATFMELVNELGVTPEPAALDRAITLRREQELHVTRPRHGVLDVLGMVRALGWRVGLLSDCTPELGDLWPHLPYTAVVDATVFSFELGHRKPAAILYSKIAARLGVEPEQCVYVGDGSSGELAGAEAAGMTPVMLKTPFDHRFRYDPEPHWSGLSIDTLEHLIPLLTDLQTH